MSKKFGLIVLVLIASMLFLFGCTQPAPNCGNGVQDSGEDCSNCPQDMPAGSCAIAAGFGILNLKITDKQVEGLEALNITISKIELHLTGAEDANWIVFLEEEKSFDLMKLHHLTDLLGEKTLAAGKYTQLRLEVKSASAVIDGNSFEVEIPSDELKLAHQFTIDEKKTTELILDFSSESLIKAGDKYILKPVIKVLSPKEFDEKVKQEKEEEKQKVEFETIEQGSYSGCTAKENSVIKDPTNWQDFWNKLKSNLSPKPGLPSIDFSSEMVIASCMGEQSSGGYSIEIDKILEKEDKLTVFIKEGFPGPGENVTLALTQPYHVVKLKISSKPVEFYPSGQESEKQLCEQTGGKWIVLKCGVTASKCPGMNYCDCPEAKKWDKKQGCTEEKAKTEGFITPGTGTLAFFLTDPPNKDKNSNGNESEDFTSLNITISKIEVHKSEGGKWLDFTDANYSATYDLMKLHDVQELLGAKKLESGHYTQIRLSVTKATVGFDDNTSAEVKVPSDKIKLVHEFIIDANKDTELLLDFKPESVHKAGSQWIMSPVIHVITLKEPELPESECDEDRPCDANKLCCSNSCIVPACTSASQCNDSNSLTLDSCSNPNSCNAKCVYTVIQNLCGSVQCDEGELCCSNSCTTPTCTSNSGCNDSNSLTIDVCINPNTCTSACTHTLDLNAAFCGNAKIDANETCANCPQDINCSSGQLCCNAVCTTPSCTSSSQCDDSNSLTTDSCSNPNTCTALCLHVYAGQLREFNVNVDVNNGFVPNSFSVSLHDTVKLNITALDSNHSIVIPDFNISTSLPYNVTTIVQFVADKNGSFSFHCGIHPSMTGTITVS